MTVFYKEGGATESKIANDTISSCTFVSIHHITELPSQLELVESEAFRNTDLRYVRIPDSCRRIKTGAFTDSNLEYISVGGATVIEDGAFDNTVSVEKR